MQPSRNGKLNLQNIYVRMQSSHAGQNPAFLTGQIFFASFFTIPRHIPKKRKPLLYAARRYHHLGQSLQRIVLFREPEDQRPVSHGGYCPGRFHQGSHEVTPG